jgi:hypothetical protein
MQHEAATFGFFIVGRRMSASSSETTSGEATNTSQQHAHQLRAEEQGKRMCPENVLDQSAGVNSRLTLLL